MIKYNVFSGKRNFGPDWLNFDGAVFPHVISDDVFLKYQPNDYADLIYCSHGIAYFSRTELPELLASWYKKLKPGGTLRLATPDFDVLVRLYYKGFQLDDILGPLFGEWSLNGNKVYHKTVWSGLDLTQVLYDAGFTNVAHYDHRKTEHPNTGNRDDFFDDHSAAYIGETLISLNLQCIKL